MPLPRWWAVEDGRTNFAAVRPDSTDLARLVFLEFALVYSNDWFQLPCDLPTGTVASIRGLAVTDVFGRKLWITPAGAGDDADWQRWSMFTLDTIGDASVPADTDLLLPPSVPKVAEGPVLEEVVLVRDESANMVWGVEQTVRLPTGEPRRGSEVAAEILAHRLALHPPAVPPPAAAPAHRLALHPPAVPPPAAAPAHRLALHPPAVPPPAAAPVRYEAMNTVPENWIPFVPVHVPGQNRQIRLQRAAMLGVVDGEPVPARTALLREGFDQGRAYFVHEEEVPQTGTGITSSFNRTRWSDGRVSLWLATHRRTGRGEASSGLAFDFLEDTAPPPGAAD
ncbi:hypothetical protein [Kitasatospora purpeofusca]|uniref:Uncharacterized protein n=1 Tax=Kitasatospora purpeofusca TaxID=67352 RepID=A0ABZ1UA86_9ACTN|nr:hypothetical protein [Kitasatospora purpeofusca]